MDDMLHYLHSVRCSGLNPAFHRYYIAPYCFEKHKMSEIQFRCTNRRCNDFDDIEMTRYENGNPKNFHLPFAME